MSGTALRRVSALSWIAVFSLTAFSGVGITQDLSLIQAIQDGNTEAVRTLVAARRDLDAVELDGSTALHWAVHKDDLVTVDLLLRAGANAKVVNRFGVSPLSLAAENGNVAILERLLKAGADANTAGTGGETVLMTAARGGNADAVRMLIAHGANVNAREDTHEQTGLMWAAGRGNSDAIKVLLDAGADLHARSVEHKEVFEDTFLAGRRTPATGERIPMFTALLFAVRDGRTDAVRLLLEQGANPNDAVPDGTTALIIACLNGNWEIGALLLDKGANPNAAANGYAPLHALARTRTINISWKGGGPPAPVSHGAMRSSELAERLIAHGADVNAKMSKQIPMAGDAKGEIGATPLIVAANPPDPELGRLLLAHGANPNLTAADGTTALNAAAGAYYRHPVGANEEALEFAKIMIDAGADVNAANEKGEIPLHHAAVRGYNPLVQYLVDKGAELDARTKNGRTPLQFAFIDSRAGAFYEHPETVALLRKLYEERGLSTVLPTREEAIEQLTRLNRFEILCPDAQTVKSSNGGPTVVTYPPARVIRGDPKTPLTCTPASGSVFPVGATTVTCSGTYAVNGVTESCTVLMRVVP